MDKKFVGVAIVVAIGIGIAAIFSVDNVENSQTLDSPTNVDSANVTISTSEEGGKSVSISLSDTINAVSP